MNRPITRERVAECLEDFLLDRAGPWDWDDFISVPLADPVLDSIRRQCASLPEQYPPEKSGTYCSKDGLAVIERLIGTLRE